MTLQMILIGSGAALGICGYVVFKLKRAHREIEQLLKTNAQLQTQKVVAETQVKHFEVRKKNEENSRNADRDTLIDGLHKSGDLRAGFSLISASRQDTTETLRQIKVHNDTYRTICQRGENGSAH